MSEVNGDKRLRVLTGSNGCQNSIKEQVVMVQWCNHSVKNKLRPATRHKTCLSEWMVWDGVVRMSSDKKQRKWIASPDFMKTGRS